MAWFSVPRPLAVLLALFLFGDAATGIELDLTSPASIKSAASTIAFDMMSYYKGNLSGQTPGVLPGPPPTPSVTNAGYFWWESGAMFGSLVDYWYYTGDTTYNDVVSQALLFQTGPDNNYLPTNQTNGMGNDDQGFWGMSAMTAAELGFPDPPPDQPQWLALAQGVYNVQAGKWDPATCNGGLHWQAFSFLNGYTYKNSIANGCFFNIAARLAVYTANDSYAVSAERTWDWMRSVEYIDDAYNVYDGGQSLSNCTPVNKQQYSYNSAIFLLGAAHMYNYTKGSQIWHDRVAGLLTATLTNFFPKGIAYEKICEAKVSTCSIDMLSFKAYLTRWMAAATKQAPFIFDQVKEVLKSSAEAAALQCSGSPADRPNGRMCGLSWALGAAWDGTSGVGQQMAAMEVIQSNLIQQAKTPLTAGSGGTSKGDPNAGSGDVKTPEVVKPITTADRAGAGILTALLAAIVVSGLAWVSMAEKGVGIIKG